MLEDPSYLEQQGVSSNRIETAAKGEAEPVVSCDDVKGRFEIA